MDDQRWMTGDGSQEMDHWRRMATNPVPFYEDIEVFAKLYDSRDHDFDFKLRSYTGTQICRHTMYWRHSSTEYDTEHYSEHYSEMAN